MTGKICKTCKGRGWVISVYPKSKPRPAYWFTRGANGERPRPCDKCETLEATR